MPNLPRRTFLKQLGGLSAGAVVLPVTTASLLNAAPVVKSPNERWRIGAIGMRYQGSVITREATAMGDVYAICDVDRHVREQARASFNSAAALCEDYRDLIARDDIDVVLIGAPDHWHAKMTIDACRAGKDVYVEKPLTLTVDEGRVIREVVAETGRVVQVGTWQRHDHRFRRAAEMIKAGRLGTIRKVTVVLGKNLTGGPFPTTPVPANLNWDRWQGQAPATEYIPERCHYNFRYWFDYAGGEMTDTGAHHLDIALWALGLDRTGPVEIAASGSLPDRRACYTVPRDFSARLKFAQGVEVEIRDEGRSGILFEGDLGRIFVNRGSLTGTPVDDLKNRPLPREAFQLYVHDNLSRPERAGKIEAISSHMGNFYDCTQSRQTPISDVDSQHRVASACHLANLAIRLGRTLNWNPETERFINDPAADKLLRREQRPGYEVV
ncbi:MAG: Gfo/Idh/MocA family oxidoreductase [Planctomycetes bacterium]|nr:Gfo/Idh/MocA family oxidoreductase [Planctomycetota bacterium]